MNSIRSELGSDIRSTIEDNKFEHTSKETDGGIILIPQPSDDLRDPLNWKNSKKHGILFSICLAAFAGLVAANAINASYPVQGKTYHKPIIQLSYSISSVTAGLAAGPLIFAPFVYVFGSSSLLLWSLVCTLLFQIWSATTTGADDYISWILSRLFVGLFGQIPSIIGARMILDMFFLHQRGRALALYNLSNIFGAISGPTFGGFIVQKTSWTVTYWWTLAPLGLAIICILFFAEETGFTRDGDSSLQPDIPRSFVANRVATFLPGYRVVPRVSISQFLRQALAPIIIGIYPVTVLAGIYTLVSFGFALIFAALLADFLQTPVIAGGYGFSPLQNAAFTFTNWVAVIVAEMISHWGNDRLPLWISRRSGHGVWHPEYRLYNLIFPALIQPIGLGIFGAGLQYHTHYMVLALGAFLNTLGAFIAIPICVIYVIECFTTHAVEASVIMNLYRLVFGLAIPFFIDPWIARVGVGWTFGMSAFFTLFFAFLLALLVWKGESLRQLSPIGVTLAVTDEGKRVNAESVGLSTENHA